MQEAERIKAERIKAEFTQEITKRAFDDDTQKSAALKESSSQSKSAPSPVPSPAETPKVVVAEVESSEEVATPSSSDATLPSLPESELVVANSAPENLASTERKSEDKVVPQVQEVVEKTANGETVAEKTDLAEAYHGKGDVTQKAVDGERRFRELFRGKRFCLGSKRRWKMLRARGP